MEETDAADAGTGDAADAGVETATGADDAAGDPAAATEPATATESASIEFADGLVPVVAQDESSGEVLMLAYATPEAVDRTLETGIAHYYSRSRDELWEKGATSGHVQRVSEVRVDCDGDALCYRVEQVGGACHTGHRSCFYRAVQEFDAADRPSADGDDGEQAADGAADGSTAADDVTVEATVETVDEPVFDPDTVYGEE